jgi:CRP-like cAMP-binding protein
MALEKLSSMSLFRHLDEDELCIMSHFIHEREYQIGELLFRQSTPANAFYMLCSGTIELFKTFTDSQSDRIRILRPGDTCGMAALWPTVRHPYNAQALDPCRMYVLTAMQFQEILDHRLALAQKLLSNLLRELWQAFDVLHTEYSNLTKKLIQSNIIV